ncbi:HEAT repeat domain-containing protein [Pelagirhabdus alkalitolerans]|uniref:HEAT repeat domain-containing protein n=1 Tax=Pelagirhabdus alkalitolerans TaxID=1612202 RepID=UPI0015A31A20|nr:HEAT repeat domain-containing protein [Pelagirhabdus alkalitolerans]
MNKRKKQIKNLYEDSFLRFITDQTDELPITPSTRLEQQVIHSLFSEYSSVITRDKKRALIETLGNAFIVKRVEKFLNSKNTWKQKAATYWVGEYELSMFTDDLYHQLQTLDPELLFVTSKSLIKLTNDQFLSDILITGTKRNRLSKSNLLALLDLVEGDISQALNEMMDEHDTYIQTIVLEAMGRRRYVEATTWIQSCLFESEKELKIAALKASRSLEYTGDDLFQSTLIDWVNDPDWEVRLFLSKYLQVMRNHRSITMLTRLASDQNWYVRYNASQSLLAHGEEGISALLSLLSAEDPFTQDIAYATLQKEAIHI